MNVKILTQEEKEIRLEKSNCTLLLVWEAVGLPITIIFPYRTIGKMKTSRVTNHNRLVQVH